MSEVQQKEKIDKKTGVDKQPVPFMAKSGEAEKYQLKKEEKDHFVVAHPDGSEFKVAKLAIDPLTMNRIAGLKKFAKGGEAEPSGFGALGETGSDVKDFLETNLQQDSGAQQSALDKYGRPDEPRSLSKKKSEPLAVDAPTSEDTNIMSQNPEPIPVGSAPYTPALQDVVQPTAGQTASSDPIADSFKAQNDLLNQQKEQIGQRQNEFNNIAGAQDNSLASIKPADDLFEVFKAHQKAEDEAYQAFQNAKVVPKGLFGNMSTPNKILASIGIALSGIGTGLAGGKNMALEVLNKAMEQDLDAQKNEQEKAGNLYQYQLKKTGRDFDAHLAVNNSHLNWAKVQIERAQAKTTNLQQQMQLDQMKNAINQQLVGNTLKMSISKTGGNSPSIEHSALYSKYLVNPSTGATPAEVGEANKELGTVQTQLSKHNQADQILDNISKQQKLGNRIANPLQSSQALDAERARLYPLVMSEDDIKRFGPEMGKTLVDPFFQKLTTGKATLAEIKNGLHSIIDSKSPPTPTLTKYQVPLPKYQQPPVERMTPNGAALFDPTTKKFLRYK